MDSNLQREILLLTEDDGLKGSEAIKILSICSHMLKTEAYVTVVKNMLDNVFNSPDFNFMTEFGHVIKGIISLNRRANYYKMVSLNRVKYVLYAVFYNYLYHQQPDVLNSLDMGEFRTLYDNTWDLLKTEPILLQIAKEGCMNWFARCTGWECIQGDDIYVGESVP